jgi:hypothetical protein
MSRTIAVTIDDTLHVQNPKQVASTEYPITAADTENIFRITIQHGGVAVNLTGLTVGTAYQLPHGEYVTGNDATLITPANGICDVVVDDDHIPYEGDQICEVSVYTGSTKLTMAKFRFHVYKSIRDLSNTSALNTGTTSFNNTFDNRILITPHNNLASKQGGTTAQYYHLTSTQHTGLTNGGSTSLHTHIADDTTIPGGTDAGVDDTYVVNSGLTAYQYMLFKLTVTAGNTGACKLSIDNGANTYDIKRLTVSGLSDPFTGDIPAGASVLLLFDGTYWVMQGNTSTEQMIEQNASGVYKIWVGTEAEYGALTPDANTLYFCTA